MPNLCIEKLTCLNFKASISSTVIFPPLRNNSLAEGGAELLDYIKKIINQTL